MNIIESLRLALESLKANTFRTALTMLGMSIGVGAVIVLVAMGEGTKGYVLGAFNSLGSNLIIIQPGRTDTHSPLGPPPGGATRPLTLEDTRALSKWGNLLVAVSPVMIGSNTAKSDTRERAITIIGTDNHFLEILNMSISTGRFVSANESFSGRRVCVLGDTVRRELFRDENPVGSIVRIGRSEFRVIGLLDRKGTSLGMDFDDLVMIPVRAFQKLFDINDLFGIRAKARTQEELATAERQCTEILKRRHHGEVDFTLVNQDDMMSVMTTVLDTLTYVLAGIAGISLLVGGIGIMNILLVSVAERTREVGLRMAVGAQRRDILKQFLAESVMISLFGGTLGILGGIGSAQAIGLISDNFQPAVGPLTIAIAVAFSFGTGLVFGVYPAWRAAALDPILALRRE